MDPQIHPFYMAAVAVGWVYLSFDIRGIIPHRPNLLPGWKSFPITFGLDHSRSDQIT
jgi:hypothetical protein